MHVIGVPRSQVPGEEVRASDPAAWRGDSSGRRAPSSSVGVGYATYKIPRYVRFTSGFPMTVTGKVQKFKMREMTVAELALARVTDVEPTLRSAEEITC